MDKLTIQVFFKVERTETLGKIESAAAKCLNIIEEKILTRETYITCDQLAVAWMLDEHTKKNPSLVKKVQPICAHVETSVCMLSLTVD